MLTAEKRFTEDLQASDNAARPIREAQSIQVIAAIEAPWAEPILLRRYGSHYASLTRLAVTGEIDGDVMLFLAREAGEVVSALLFRRAGERVRVLNEVVTVSTNEIQQFARYVFARWPDVSVIGFNAIHTDLNKSKFPFQRFNHLEDFVIALPQTADAYRLALGSSLRKTLRTFGNKIRRLYPSFSHEVQEAADIDEQNVRAILEFSRARITAKGKKWGIDEAECERIVALARTCGVVSVISINGQVCAGAISFRAGDAMFMRVCSHDPAFDDLRLGTVARFYAIEALIDRGAKSCHLLWGKQPYKYQFLATPQPLDNVTLYRSWAHMLGQRRLVLQNMRRAAIRSLKAMAGWLRDRELGRERDRRAAP
ncbi:MAG: family N-acetyltransferase [Herminiimonas sp.]|nr:family N-acetyltransferase [Herminiimonas sp.]MDB5852372.1 family N-acetyltransferase [Herminiimonas sp.]